MQPKLLGIQGNEKIWPNMRRKKKKTIETEIGVTQRRINKDIKTIITIFHVFEEAEERLS